MQEREGESGSITELLPWRSCLHSELGGELVNVRSDVCPSAISSVLINGAICALSSDNSQAGPGRSVNRAWRKELQARPPCLPKGHLRNAGLLTSPPRAHALPSALITLLVTSPWGWQSETCVVTAKRSCAALPSSGPPSPLVGSGVWLPPLECASILLLVQIL